MSFQAKIMSPKSSMKRCDNELIALFVNNLLNAAGHNVVYAMVPHA